MLWRRLSIYLFWETVVRGGQVNSPITIKRSLPKKWLLQVLLTFWIAVPKAVISILLFIFACIKVIRIWMTIAVFAVVPFLPPFCFWIHLLADLAAFWNVNISLAVTDSVGHNSCFPRFFISLSFFEPVANPCANCGKEWLIVTWSSFNRSTKSC